VVYEYMYMARIVLAVFEFVNTNEVATMIMRVDENV
jgi:hypothetical protein